MLIVHLFVSYAHVNLCHFFSFSWCRGVGCGFCLWLFLDFSVYLFSSAEDVDYCVAKFISLVRTLDPRYCSGVSPVNYPDPEYAVL